MSVATPFREQSFSQRYQQLGDQAEGVCAEVLTQLGIKFARYGFNRPPFSIQKLPLHVRYTPDYATPEFLVECQGLGRDGIVKVKRDKLAVMWEWEKEMSVHLFLWWSTRKQWALVPLIQVTAAIDNPELSTLGFFDGSKAYFGLKAAGLCDWTKMP